MGMGYCVQPTPPPTQTISGHIYNCPNATPTTDEVPGGTLAVTSGPQTSPGSAEPAEPDPGRCRHLHHDGDRTGRLHAGQL